MAEETNGAQIVNEPNQINENGNSKTLEVLEAMDESGLKKEIKSELSDEKLKSEPKEEEMDESISDKIKTEPTEKDVENSLTMRKEFSSENFKIEVKNLPKFWGVGQMKKLFEKQLQLNYHR